MNEIQEPRFGKTRLTEWLDIEFALLGVTAYGVIATPEHKRKFPLSVTIATTSKIDDGTLEMTLVDCEVDYWKHKRYRIQSIESYIKQTLESRFQPSGIAVCDHRDLLDPELGKVIAEGRLLKMLKQEKTRHRTARLRHRLNKEKRLALGIFT